jgi:starch phosphorylase
MARARQLAEWKQHLAHQFGQIRIESVQDNMDTAGVVVGQRLEIDATLALGDLTASDVAVELYYGSLDTEGQLFNGRILPMEQTDFLDDNRVRYRIAMPCEHSGMVGYTLRVLPAHPMLDDALSMDLLKWA